MLEIFAIFMILILMLYFGVVACAFLFPAKLTSYVLTDGKKTVHYESMQHIGSSNYYDSVRSKIFDRKSKGDVYFYERVKKPEKSYFGQTDSIMFLLNGLRTIGLMELYSAVARCLGVTVQPQNSFLNLVNDHDINVDVDVDDMLVRIKKSPEYKNRKMIVDMEKVEPLIKKFCNSKFSNRFVAMFLTGLVTLATKFIHKAPPLPYQEVFLDYRNAVLCDAIINEPNNMVITYGAAHFDGVFEMLRKQNPNWKIISQSTRNTLI